MNHVDEIVATFETFERIFGRPVTTDERTMYFAGRMDGLREESQRTEGNKWKTAKAGNA